MHSPKTAALWKVVLFFVKDKSDILEKCNRNDAIVFNGWGCIVFQDFFLDSKSFPKGSMYGICNFYPYLPRTKCRSTKTVRPMDSS